MSVESKSQLVWAYDHHTSPFGAQSCRPTRSHPSSRWRFSWFLPQQLLPSSAFLPTRGRLRALLTAARRLAAVARATDPQADGPGFFESTSTSCVPLYATEPADEPSDEAACHARRIREECGKRKAIAQLFSRATCLELDRATAAFSFSFKAASHLYFVASSYHCMLHRLNSVHEFQVVHQLSLECSLVDFVSSRRYCRISLLT